jgi:hypothetical protein
LWVDCAHYKISKHQRGEFAPLTSLFIHGSFNSRIAFCFLKTMRHSAYFCKCPKGNESPTPNSSFAEAMGRASRCLSFGIISAIFPQHSHFQSFKTRFVICFQKRALFRREEGNDEREYCKLLS